MNSIEAETLRVLPIVNRLKKEARRTPKSDFKTEVYVTDQDGQVWEIEVGVSYDATYQAEYISGPPEDCYPAYGSMDITGIQITQDNPPGITDKDILDAAELDNERIEELAWEDYHSKKYDGRDE